MTNPYTNDYAALGLAQSVWDTTRAATPPTDAAVERARANARAHKAAKTAKAQRLRDKERAIALATRVNPESNLARPSGRGVARGTGAMRTI
jgi:hypothetical protein